MGIVSTNAYAINSGGGSGPGGANGADLPTRLKSLSSNGGNGFVKLSLEYENTDYISGIQVNYKLGDYPTSPSDGNIMTVTGAPTTIKVDGLANKSVYYFRVFPYNEVDGTKYYQTDITNAKTSCMPKALEIAGATIFEEGDGYIALITGQTFTMSAPEGTKITLVGGGSRGNGRNGGYGGKGLQFTLDAPVDNQTCTLSVGAALNAYNSTGLTNTILTIGETDYTTNGQPVNRTYNTKFGTVGGAGKSGEYNELELEEQARLYRYGNGGNGGGARAGLGGTCAVNVLSINTGVSYSGGNGGGGTGAKVGATNTAIKNVNSSGTTQLAAGGNAANSCGKGGDGKALLNGYALDDYFGDDPRWDLLGVGGGGGGGGFGGGGGGGGGNYPDYSNTSANNSAGGHGFGGIGICVIEWPT